MKKFIKLIVIILSILSCLIIGYFLHLEEDKSYINWEAKVIESINSSENSSHKININTATAYRLSLLSGIGEETAKRIVEYRSNNGDFEVIEDLMKIDGFGRKSFDKIKHLITV